MNTDESCLAANVLSKNCPSRVTLMHLTNRWGVLVIFSLRKGTHRFSELRRRIDGISEKMLTQTLRDLERFKCHPIQCACSTCFRVRD